MVVCVLIAVTQHLCDKGNDIVIRHQITTRSHDCAIDAQTSGACRSHLPDPKPLTLSCFQPSQPYDNAQISYFEERYTRDMT